MEWTRREFLSRGGRAALGLGVARSLGFRFPQPFPHPGMGQTGDPYLQLGWPRGLMLSHVEDLGSTRTVTWLTSGETDPGSNVEFGVVPEHGAHGAVMSGRVFDRSVVGDSEMAPYGFGDDGENFGQPMPGEQPVRVHRGDYERPPGPTIRSSCRSIPTGSTPTERRARSIGSRSAGGRRNCCSPFLRGRGLSTISSSDYLKPTGSSFAIPPRIARCTTTSERRVWVI